MVGSFLKTNNSQVKISSIEKIDSRETVFNFEGRKNHNYFVTSEMILIHNKNIPLNMVSNNLSDITDTSDIFKDFEECLRKYCRPVYENLEKGLDSEHVDSILAKLQIDNRELRKMYYWQNGIKADTGKYIGEFDFCSQGKMLPLEEAATHYEIYIKENQWKKNYFPLITTHAGDYLLYDVDKDSKTYGMLLFYSPSLLIVEPETAYDSLESFFETIISCYQQGIYKFNESSNTLEVDHNREFKISIEKNPKSKYWKEE